MLDILVIALFAILGLVEGYFLRQVFKVRFVPGEDPARKKKRNLMLTGLAAVGVSGSLFIADYGTRDDVNASTLAYVFVALMVGFAASLLIGRSKK